MRLIREQEIKSLEEVTNHSVKYWFIDDSGKRTGKWLWIEWIDDEQYFSINRKMYSHQLYNFEISGNYVRTWKTLSGAIRFCKKQYSELIE